MNREYRLSRIGKTLLIAMIFACASLVSEPSHARRMVIDFNAPSDVGATGESFTFDNSQCGAGSTAAASCVVDLTDASNPSSDAVLLGFNIKIGPTTFDRLFINENGVVTFGSALGAFTSQSSFASLQALVNPAGTRPFIAPFYADLTPGTEAGGSPTSVFSFGGILYGRGRADPAPDPDPNATPPFTFANTVPAFHVFWVDPTTSLFRQAEVILYSTDQAAGNFDLRIRYGSNDGEQFNVPGAPQGLAGFVLGASSVVLSDPFVATPTPLNADSDYLYHFCGGVLSTTTCAVTTVDTDIDGIADSVDNCPLIANNNQANSDTDALGDACDNCPLTANPDQKDSNHNGVGDACEPPPPPTPARCDVDGDKDIDLLDLKAIAIGCNRTASSPTDPRDADGNGRINLKDFAICVRKCTRKNCALR